VSAKRKNNRRNRCAGQAEFTRWIADAAVVLRPRTQCWQPSLPYRQPPWVREVSGTGRSSPVCLSPVRRDVAYTFESERALAQRDHAPSEHRCAFPSVKVGQRSDLARQPLISASATSAISNRQWKGLEISATPTKHPTKLFRIDNKNRPSTPRAACHAAPRLRYNPELSVCAHSC
jgi:hypothetical protein